MSLKMATLCFLNLTSEVRRTFSGVICVLAVSSTAGAWGPHGHRIVGAIAQNHLNPKATEQVKRLLQGETLARASTWADEIKSDPNYKGTETWHYVAIPNGQTYSQVKKNLSGDILTALKDGESTLRSESASREKKTEALKFLIHFVGDLHQPLHIDRGTDRGGNLCFVRWMLTSGKNTLLSNLHEVWDSLLIESQKLSYSEYSQFLDTLPEDKQKKLRAGDFETWAMESMTLREKIYPPQSEKYCKKSGFPSIKDQPILSWDYRFEHMKSLEEQLQKGGLRLAEKLNSIWH